jgi:orotidine-5'-phosphate decarboxylase
MTLAGRDRIFVALDSPDEERILGLARLLRGRVGGFKVGLEAFTANGPGLVRKVAEEGIPVFLDLKLHDIPNTVAGAAAAAARLGVSFLTVHALGGDRMIRAAVDASGEAAASAGLPPPVLLAVTILTSHDDASLRSLGVAGPCADAVRRLAEVARAAGAQGLVCSAEEIELARAAHPRAVLVVPGIRPAGAAAHDQSRTATPSQAIARGADRLVVGRPITGAPDPAAAADAIARDAGAGALP